MEIKNISFKHFNEISIDSLCVRDLSNKDLAIIEHIDASIKLLPLLRGDIIAKEIDLDKLNLHLQVDTNGNANYQFVIDALMPKEGVPIPTIKFPIINIENSKIHYQNLSNNGLQQKYPQVINPNDLFIYDLNTKVKFNLSELGTKIAIYTLCLKEKSGFSISNIQCIASFDNSKINIPFINIDLPKSQINLDSLYAKIKKDGKRIDLSTSSINFNITNTLINPSDIKNIVPQLGRLKKEIFIDTKVNGSLNKINAQSLIFKYGDKISANMDLKADSIFDINKIFFFCKINHIQFDKPSIQDIISNLTNKPFLLPNELNHLGLCKYIGKISGTISDLMIEGTLSSNIGSIRTDFNLHSSDKFKTININGGIGSNRLELGSLLPNSGLGHISFDSNSKINIHKNKFDINTKLQIEELAYNDYKYHDISIDGNISPTQFTGQFLLNDPNGYINFNGTLSKEGQKNHAEFTAKIQNLNLNKLHLIKTHPNLSISLNTNSNFSGSELDNMIGYLNLDSIYLTNGNNDFKLKKLELLSENDTESFLKISSDLINSEIYGKYKFVSLYNNILYSLSKKMPILKGLNLHNPYNEDEITCHVEIEGLKQLFNVLDINWHTTAKASADFKYSSITDEFKVNIFVPSLSNGKNNIDSITLSINNNSDIDIALTAKTNLKNGILNAGFNIKALDNNIYTSINWDNYNIEKSLAGEFAAQTSLKTDAKNNFLSADIKIIPTELLILNKLWNVNESYIWTDLEQVSIDKFKIHSEDNQIISINGKATKDNNEKLDIKLKDISLDYIDKLLPENTEISFGGIVNGYATIANIFTLPEIDAHIKSHKFYFDESYFGNAIANCKFDHSNTSLRFDGIVINDNADTTAILKGNYFIPNDSLDIKGSAYGLDIAFIDYYIEKVFGKVTGNAWGNVHIHGITKTKNVAVDVDALAKDASIYVDFLKTKFFLSDTIHVDKNVIDFGEIDITDITGNTGTVKGKIEHNYFRDIKLDLSIDVNDMLVMNTNRKDSESFYGQVFGTGNVRIKGDDDEINIICKAKTEKGTNIVIPIDNYYASENSFIIFKSSKEFTDSVETIKDIIIDKDTTTNIKLDLMLDVTPDAQAKLIIDSKSGDMLKGNGNGNLRITYDDRSEDINIYGTYQIEQGSYLFTFQNALRKEFYIKEGSSIAWTGDPLNATVNIDAYYQLTADLAEILSEAILSNTSRTSVPVQCLLNLSGLLTQPNIKFDINLPNSEEELNRALKNSINTEELMNRQIIGLLILGKFISPETMQSSVISQNELYSVVSSTLSAQLNNWASQMFNNWGFGVNFRTSGEGESRSNEYEFNFVYTPTSRLIINGNVGYRDDALSSTNFIGDFDIEYKLIQSGKLRAKAYTHTNDYREFKKGLTTQGIGIVYSENFNSLKDLWQSWKDNIRKNKEEYRLKKEDRKQKRQERKLRKEQKKQQSTKNDSIN